MRVVLQRVLEASVTIDGVRTAAIGRGMLVLCGFEEADNQEDLDWMARKIAALRIYDDEDGVMNRAKYEENKANLPDSYQEVELAGGNHAQPSVSSHTGTSDHPLPFRRNRKGAVSKR